jgi:hypothetical protein
MCSKSRTSSTAEAHSGIPLAVLDLGTSVRPMPHLESYKMTSREARLGGLPVDSDETDAKAFCHFIVETGNISYTTQTQEYDKRMAR